MISNKIAVKYKVIDRVEIYNSSIDHVNVRARSKIKKYWISKSKKLKQIIRPLNDLI